SPVLPALTPQQNPIPTGFAVASPSIGTPTFNQKAILTATSLAPGAALVFGTPSVQPAPIPASLTVGSPTLGTPTFNQSAVLAATSIAVGSPSLPATLFQQNPIAVTLAVGSPTFTAPVSGFN